MGLPWSANDILTATDLNAAFGGGAAWTSFTPTLTQSGTVTKTVTRAGYIKMGRLVHVSMYLTVTGTGTATNGVLFGLPVTAANGADACGSGFIFDASVPLAYPGTVWLQSTTTAGLMLAGSLGANAGAASSGFTAALANTDQIRAAFFYESAT